MRTCSKPFILSMNDMELKQQSRLPQLINFLLERARETVEVQFARIQSTKVQKWKSKKKFCVKININTFYYYHETAVKLVYSSSFNRYYIAFEKRHNRIFLCVKQLQFRGKCKRLFVTFYDLTFTTKPSPGRKLLCL